MSVKRQATSELNHDNWDQDDPSDQEEMGTFKTAAKEVLEKRVIRTAKRRATASEDEPKKNLFSGFGSFNKPPPSSFDFLANLTNGSKATNGNASPKIGSTSTPASNQADNKTSGSIFNSSVTTPVKTTFGMPPSTSGSIFGGSLSKSAQSPSAFSKIDSTADFSNKPIDSIAKATNANINSKTNYDQNDNTKEEITDEKKLTYYSKLKNLNESVSDWIKKHVQETPLCILTPIFKDYEKYLKEIQGDYHGTKADATDKSNDKKPDSQPISEGKSTFNSGNVGSASNFGGIKYNKTSEKSESISFGIKTDNKINSNQTSSANFSFGIKPSTNSENKTTDNFTSPTKSESFSFGIKTDNKINSNQTSSANFSFGIKPSTNSENKTTDNFTSPTKSTTIGAFSMAASTPLSSSGFGSKTDDPSSTSATNSKGFSFGINSSPATTSTTGSTLFTLTNTTTNSDGSPFSFGTGKPFSFSPNVQKPAEPTSEQNNEEDEPPKVEYTPIVEENSVFDSKCKIFVKKDGNFADKGVGTLYIKKIEESGKHQLLVRANTNLGNILLNMILSSSIPTQRLGKNNVMIVCIPTPESKPPPTPILIRVKTSEEADALLEILNKYKG